jgi:hypothetical protein
LGAAASVVVCMLSIGTTVIAQDVAREAMRKEVETKRKEREAMFARMRAMAPAPLAQDPLVVRGVQPRRGGSGFAPAPLAQDPLVVRERILLQQQILLQEQQRRLLEQRMGVQVANGLFIEIVQAESSPAVAATEIDDDVEAEIPVAAVPAPARRVWVVSEGTFDRSLFGGLADSPAERARLEGILTRLIDRVEETSRIPLTTAQKRKLKLAGRGDIKHFYDQVFQGRRRFESLRMNLNQCQVFLAELQPLQREFRNGPFQSDSLYAKTLTKIRDELRNEGRESK